MKKNDDIERVLAITPIPKVVEGPHRIYLKQTLVHRMQKEEIPMRTWRKTLAWACCLLLIGALGGWAGQKAYKCFIVDEEVLIKEELILRAE